MIILIGGCRYYDDYKTFCKYLDSYFSEIDNASNITILSGHCSGADMLAERYAEEMGYQVELFPADWRRFGKAAGPIRNKQMVEKADIVIAFWDNKSKGTKSLIGYAEKLKKPLRIVEI